jgi:phage-related protein
MHYYCSICSSDRSVFRTKSTTGSRPRRRGAIQPLAQLGLQPRDGKWLTDIGPGVQEIRIAYSKEAYRVIYVARLADRIYVLHAFHKKAKKGIATPKEELDLASKRYKELVKALRRS